MIRKVKLKDLPELYHLELLCFAEEPWNLEQLQSHIQHAEAILLELDKPVAYILFCQTLDFTEVYRIGVLPEHRRNGFASQLLDVLVANATRLILEVAESNRAALAFYLHKGFVVVARRNEYYATGTALLLERV
ncbi:MAG: GNAT family N-acetyltransferase [Spirochaetota bacterium]